MGDFVDDAIYNQLNTDAANNRVYWKLDIDAPAAGQATVSIYSDSAGTNLVAEGAVANARAQLAGLLGRVGDGVKVKGMFVRGAQVEGVAAARFGNRRPVNAPSTP